MQQNTMEHNKNWVLYVEAISGFSGEASGVCFGWFELVCLTVWVYFPVGSSVKYHYNSIQRHVQSL